MVYLDLEGEPVSDVEERDSYHAPRKRQGQYTDKNAHSACGQVANKRMRKSR